jgi:hypothetical protein
MTREETKLSEDDMDKLVAVFTLLFKWDKEQNPENYKNTQKENSSRNEEFLR